MGNKTRSGDLTNYFVNDNKVIKYMDVLVIV